ncbi:MAG: hypothetical protein JST50_15135 [Bacteroidetes bacterium]|nr:hypothetical protein [Bacteroidota bacterium]
MAHYTFRTDLFRWLSAFQLFSRNNEPFQLSYRDILADQSITPWELVVLNPQWRSYHAIWFPARAIDDCIKSMMTDLAYIIRKDHSGFGRKKIKERFIYHALFYFLKRYPQNENCLGRQFRIQDKENNEVFISDFCNE